MSQNSIETLSIPCPGIVSKIAEDFTLPQNRGPILSFPDDEENQALNHLTWLNWLYKEKELDGAK